MFTRSMALSEHGVHRYYPKIDQNGKLNGNGKFKKPLELGRDPIPRQTRVSTNKETHMYYVWGKHGLPRIFEAFETGFQNEHIPKTNGNLHARPQNKGWVTTHGTPKYQHGWD